MTIERVWIDMDEWWPVYEIVEKDGVREVELPASVVEHARQVFLEWKAVQNLLHEAVEAAR